MKDYAEKIQAHARELLAAGKVDCVIGYETGSDGVNARPAFVYKAEDVGRLTFDDTCTHDLVTYLRNRKGKATAVVVKPCDARAVNLLLLEHQLQREQVVVIGLVCPGVRERAWGQKGEALQGKCQVCAMHNPPIYDYLVGQPIAEEPSSAERYAPVAALAEKSPEERLAFWQAQQERCIRCYACRQTCPGCYCTECFADRLDPQWLGIRVDGPANGMWHTIRAFHLAGRCIGCDECQRVCPVGIPLSLLNRKLEQKVDEAFKFRPGQDAQTTPPLATFTPGENLGVDGGRGC